MWSIESFRRSGAVAVAVASLAVAGCGSSSSPPAPAPAPTTSSISPTSGPGRGGTAFTITGANFAAGASVTIGGAVATGVTVVSPTSITGTTANHGAGDAAVVVANADGKASAGNTTFTYVAAPTISLITPGTLPTGGGAVLIEGSGYASPVRVFFGGVEATGVSVLSATQVAATAPARTAATVDVLLQNPDGQQVSLPGALTYSSSPPPPPATQPPTVTLPLTPSSGPDTGGTAVTITGTNFDGATTVTLGGARVTVGLVNTAGTSLGIVTSAHAAGLSDLVVANGAGQASVTGAFTFQATVPAPPVLTALVPSQGSVAGGTAVTLTGTGFDRPTVKFGANQATVLSSSATSIAVTTPAGALGPVAVTVTNFDGQPSAPANFLYKPPPPTVLSVTPPANAAGSTTPVTITGTGFAAGATVAFGTTPATSVVVVSATTITAVTPGLPTQTVSVVVTNPDGQSSNTDVTYAYTPGGPQPAPVITGITDPGGAPLASAVLTGGQAFVISGSNFFAGATVTFGGVAPPSFTVGNTGLSITGIVPAHAVGSAPVVVTTVGGPSNAFPFTYTNPPPVILALSVEGAPFAGGTSVFIAGTGFSATATVTFGGVASASVSRDPATGGLSVLVPASPPGAAADRFEDLVVTNPDVPPQHDTFPNFHRGPPPTVLSVSPSGPGVLIKPGNGDIITVTGTDFTADATGPRAGLQISVGGVTIPALSKTATQVTFTVPKVNVFQKTSFPVQISNFDKQFGTSTDRLFFP